MSPKYVNVHFPLYEVLSSTFDLFRSILSSATLYSYFHRRFFTQATFFDISVVSYKVKYKIFPERIRMNVGGQYFDSQTFETPRSSLVTYHPNLPYPVLPYHLVTVFTMTNKRKVSVSLQYTSPSSFFTMI